MPIQDAIVLRPQTHCVMPAYHGVHQTRSDQSSIDGSSDCSNGQAPLTLTPASCNAIESITSPQQMVEVSCSHVAMCSASRISWNLSTAALETSYPVPSCANLVSP